MGWFFNRNNRNRRSKTRIEKIINKIYLQVFRDVKGIFFKNKKYDEKHIFVNKYENSRLYNKYVNKVSSEVSKVVVNQNKNEWRKYYNKAKKNKKLNLPPYPVFEKDILEKVTENSYKFIKSIPSDILELNKLKYVETLQNGVLKGTATRNELEKLVTELGSKYGKMVARTETSRLQTAVIEHRAKKLNARVYVWDSANDKRTRDSHRKMNGVIVPWYSEEKKKPYLDNMYGHAGEFPNCRCGTEPVFEEDDLPSGNSLKIYNWERKKVVPINRKKLLEMIDLDKGE